MSGGRTVDPWCVVRGATCDPGGGGRESEGRECCGFAALPGRSAGRLPNEFSLKFRMSPPHESVGEHLTRGPRTGLTSLVVASTSGSVARVRMASTQRCQLVHRSLTINSRRRDRPFAFSNDITATSPGDLPDHPSSPEPRSRVRRVARRHLPWSPPHAGHREARHGSRRPLSLRVPWCARA